MWFVLYDEGIIMRWTGRAVARLFGLEPLQCSTIHQLQQINL